MKIHGRKTGPIDAVNPFAGSAPLAEASPAEAPPSAGDIVDLSSTKEVRNLKETVRAMPSVRVEKVEGLRDAIEEGSYYVESEKLARKVVIEVLSDELRCRSQGKGPL